MALFSFLFFTPSSFERVREREIYQAGANFSLSLSNIEPGGAISLTLTLVFSPKNYNKKKIKREAKKEARLEDFLPPRAKEGYLST